MAKQKVTTANEHLDDDELFVVVKEIEHSLDLVEQKVPVYTPDLAWFEHLVVEEKQKLRKKFIFDVVLFCIVAMFVLSVVLFTLYSAPVVFFMIQGLVAVFIITYFTFQYVKQVKET